MKYSVLLKNIPNFLSLLRLTFSPLILIFTFEKKYFLSFILVCFLTLTDFLDGYFARKFKAQTILGKFLDPLSDKFFTFFSLLSYTFFSEIKLNPLIFFTLLIRDVVLILGGMYLKKYGFVPEPSVWGKASTLFVSLSLICVSLNNFLGKALCYTNFLQYTALAFIIVSFFDYTLKGVKYIKSERNKGKKMDSQIRTKET